MVGLSGPGRRYSSRCRSDSVTPNTPAMTAREPTSPRPARLKVPMSGSVGCGPDCHHQMPRAIASTVNTTMASTIQRRRARRPRSCDGCASGSASSGGTGPIRLTCWPWSGSTLSRCGSWSGPPGTSQRAVIGSKRSAGGGRTLAMAHHGTRVAPVRCLNAWHNILSCRIPREGSSAVGASWRGSALTDLVMEPVAAQLPGVPVLRRHLGRQPLPAGAWATAVTGTHLPDGWDHAPPYQRRILAEVGSRPRRRRARTHPRRR